MELICSEDPYAKYTPGVYEAECVGGEICRDPRFKSHKCRLDFELIPGGEVVSGFYHLGSGRRPRMGRGCRFMRAVAIAKGDAPRKGDVLGPDVFRGKLFEVEVRDVTCAHDGKEHPACLTYSTVKDTLRRTHP
jgi:hypothetical protein